MDYERVQAPFHSAADGAWIVTRYEDCLCVLRSPHAGVPSDTVELVTRVSEKLGGRFKDLVDLVGGLSILQNSPEHDTTRAFLHRIIRAISAAHQGPRIGAEAFSILDAVHPDQPEFDVIPPICHAFPGRLLGGSLGYTDEEIRRMQSAGGQVTEGWRPAMSLREYERRQTLSAGIGEMVAQRWQSRGCPVLGASGPKHGIAVLPAEKSMVGSMVILLVVAFETIVGFLGNVLYLLAHRLDLQDMLRREPQRESAFVEEALRLCGPVRQRPRVVMGDGLEVGGATIPRGALVQVKLESAGRDPAAYGDPDCFDIDRKGPPVLAFGAGSHICAGAMLARTMTKSLLRELLGRFSLVPGQTPPRLLDSRDLRQFASLPLRLVPVRCHAS